MSFNTKLDKKRMKMLLGVESFINNYFQAPTVKKNVYKNAETQTIEAEFSHAKFQLESPQIIKKQKQNNTQQISEATTINPQDDELYCHEVLTLDDPSVSTQLHEFKDKPNQLPYQKSQYKIDPNYIQEFNDKEYNYKTRAIILNRIQQNCDNLHIEYTHKAIYLYDLFMNKLTGKNNIGQQQLRFLSLAIIFVTAKMNTETPNINHLLAQSTLNMTKQDLYTYERLILKTLDWNTNPVTLEDVVYAASYKLLEKFTNLQNKTIKERGALKVSNQEIWFINKIVSVIILDINYLQYELDALAFSILYVIFKVEMTDEQFDSFLKEHNRTLMELHPAIKFVQRFSRILYQIAETEVSMDSLEILKLVCD